MRILKSIILFQISMVVYGFLYMGLGFLIDTAYYQFYKIMNLGTNSIIHGVYSIYGIIEWLLFLPIILWFAYFTTKGIVMENRNPLDASKNSFNLLKIGIKSKLKFSAQQKAEK